MYQACDYHTVTGYVYVNLFCSIELTTLNKKSYGYSQNLSDLWLASPFVISVELVLVFLRYDLQWWMLTPLSPMNPNSAKISYSNEKRSIFYKPKGTLGGKKPKQILCQDLSAKINEIRQLQRLSYLGTAPIQEKKKDSAYFLLGR